jgi:hypothetical protein
MGCPTDIAIMGAMNKVGGNGHVIEGPFDAFKFPTSEMVQFRALVTPCLPTCEPVKCNVKSIDGSERETDSFGRKRRKRRNIDNTINSDNSSIAANEEIVVVQTIQISDKFGFGRNDRKRGKSADETNNLGSDPSPDGKIFFLCLNIIEMKKY